MREVGRGHIVDSDLVDVGRAGLDRGVGVARGAVTDLIDHVERIGRTIRSLGSKNQKTLLVAGTADPIQVHASRTGRFGAQACGGRGRVTW